MQGLRRFYRQSLFSFKALFGWLDPRIYILVKVINPILMVTFFCLLVRYVYQAEDVTPYIIGNAMVLCYYNAIFGVGNVLAAERFYGTLKMVVAAPINKFMVFVGRGAFHIVDGVVTILISLGAGALIFGIDFQGSFWQLLLILLVGTYSVFGLGLVISSIGLVTRDMNLVMNLTAKVILVFTGANFPVSRFPAWVETLAQGVPLARGIEAARMTATGADWSQIQSLLVSEWLLGTLFVVVGFAMFYWMERLAIREGSFDLY